MKLICMLLTVVLFGAIGTVGFSSERNLAPIEKSVFTDFDYDFDVVVSFENENEMLNVDLSKEATNLYRPNQPGLPSTSIVMEKMYIMYAPLDEWKTNKEFLTYRRTDKNYAGGLNLKISLE